ncbi:MAG: hypothetical protein V4454_10520 [Pseudomonadota bacterium]
MALGTGFFKAAFGTGFGAGFLLSDFAVGLATGLAAAFTGVLEAGLLEAFGFTTAFTTGFAAALAGVLDLFAGLTGFAGAFTRCLLGCRYDAFIASKENLASTPFRRSGSKPGYCSRRAIVAAGPEAVSVLKQTVGESIQT